MTVRTQCRPFENASVLPIKCSKGAHGQNGGGYFKSQNRQDGSPEHLFQSRKLARFCSQVQILVGQHIGYGAKDREFSSVRFPLWVVGLAGCPVGSAFWIFANPAALSLPIPAFPTTICQTESSNYAPASQISLFHRGLSKERKKLTSIFSNVSS